MSDAAPWEDYQQQMPEQGPWADYAAPATAQGGVMGALKGASRALEANLPFVDRAVAAAKGGDYATNLATERAKNQQFTQDNPWTNALGGITASAPLMAVGGEGPLAARTAMSGLGLGLAGELQGISSSPDLTNSADVGPRAAEGFGIGGLLGAAAPPIAAGIGKAISPLAAGLARGPGAADVAKLGGDVTAAYQNVKDLGAAYSPAAFQNLTDKIAADAAEADIDPGLNPKASAIIKNLQARAAAKAESGEALTLPELDKMRQFVNDNLGGLPEPKQARFGALIKGNIDDFIKNAEPSQIGDSTPRLVVANRMPDGSIKYGQPGQVHSDLFGGDEDAEAFARQDKNLGFAQPGGPFMSRQQAADFVAQKEPLRTPEAYEQGESFLQAEPYTEPERMAQFDSARGGIAPNQAPPAPTAADASGAIQTARDLAMRQFKAKALADALNKAGISADTAGTGGNIENATRQRLARLLDKEPWSPDEIDQLNDMIHGNRVTNTLRQFSRFGPKGNALMAAMELGSGSPRAIGAAVGGTAAQAGEALTRRAGQGKLLATILAGGKAPEALQIPSRAALATALAARQQLPQQQNMQR